jgi:soluble lytic murein transglycosylase-like protein
MSDAQLQQYARMHKDDPYIMPLAASEAKRRQQTRQAAMGQQAAQQATQPTIADKSIASMQLPEEQGIGVLPAQNIEGMADGGIAGYAKGGVPENTEEYRAYALRKAREFGLDPKFVDAIFQIESGYKSTAKSKTGPVGIGQLTKATAKTFNLDPKERTDPYKNMDTSMSLMKYLFDKYKDPAKVAIAYNQGEGVLNDHLKQNKGKLVPERLHQNVRTTNKQEPANYLKKLNNYIPISAAAAAEVVPRGEFKPSESSGAPAARGVTALPTLPKAPAPAPAPAPAATSQKAPSGKAAAVTDDTIYDPISGLPIAGGVASQEGPQTKAPVTSLLTGTADVLLGIPEAITNVVTQDYYVATGQSAAEARRAAQNNPMVKAAGYLRSGKWFGVENDPAYRKDPLSLIASLPAMGVEGVADKFGLDKDAAQLALDNALLLAPAIRKVGQVQYNLPKLPGKEKPSISATDAQTAVKSAMDEVRAAEAKTEAPRLPAPAADTPGVIRTTPEGIAVLPSGEAAAARARGARGLAEDQLALDAARRKLAQAETTAAAASKAPGTKTLAERFGALPFTSRAGVPYGILSATTDLSGAGEAAPEKRPYEPWEENFPAPDKVEEAKKVAETVAPTAEEPKPKTGGLSNEDILTMGLNMLMAQPGQPGGELSQLASNVGRSGLATLQARRDREKLAKETAYQDTMGDYYKKLTQMHGRPDVAERQIAEVMKANPGMSYLEAIEALSKAQYAPRAESAEEIARLRNPFTALFGQGYMEPSGSLSPQGQAIFNQFYPKS